MIIRGRITIFSTLTLAITATTPIFADTEMEELFIEGERLEEGIPNELSQYGNQLEIVTSEEISKRGFVDISETLKVMVPGLHISQKNGPFDYITASLQGSRNQEILWLVDGVRITNRLYNGTSPLDTLPVHMVERIEVLKGGQGIFYGTQAVGGVINIVTKRFQDETDAVLGLGTNSAGGRNAHMYARGAIGSQQFVFYASKDEADGYQPYRDSDIQPSSTDNERSYDVSTVGAKYAWNINPESRLSLQAHFTDADLDYARPYLNNSTVNAREETILSAKYDSRINDNIELFIKAYHHDWDTEYTRIYNELDDEGNLTGNTVIRNDASYWGYEDYGLNAMVKLNYQTGFEYVLGFDQQNFSGEDEVWAIADQEETVNAPFVQIRTTEELLQNTSLALGVRNNRPSNSGSVTVWNLTGKHDFNNTIYVQGNLGTSFRMPDAEALFLDEFYDDDNDGVPDGGWFAIGNPDLEPEESENLNVSIGGNFSVLSVSTLSFELTGFTRKITNYIESYVPLTIGGVVGESFTNTDDKVHVDGYELSSSLALTDQWSATLSHTHTLARINGDGTQLTGIPKRESKLQIGYNFASLPAGLSLSLNAVGDVNARQDSVADSYVVADLAAFYQLGENQQHQFVARIENVTDQLYATGVGAGTVDTTGDSYLYENLGMPRTLHVSYEFQF